jgi:hypothetical protein
MITGHRLDKNETFPLPSEMKKKISRFLKWGTELSNFNT